MPRRKSGKIMDYEGNPGFGVPLIGASGGTGGFG